ncbi:MAG: Ldh family oxidoreductase [Bryobacteraceae bacterium]|nr:Ldh family oxidoreductase [Bryobacteraceae bacterium]
MPQTLPAPALREIGTRLLAAAGVPPDNAAFVAETLVAANLRGIDSHGIHLLSYYLKHLAAGTLDPVLEGRVISESGACLAYDGQNGLGQITARHCANHAVRLAGEHGIYIVTAREANHFGACFWWARSIARNGMIGLVCCNSSNLVAPWQGRQPRFGTNPICMAVPPAEGGTQEPWLLDMATTTVAANKIFKAHINRQPEIPAGWAMDAEGVPTTSTEAAYHGGLLAPLGGYKGYGLAMLAEILSAILGGGAFGPELGGIRFTDRPVRVSHCYIAIDVARFMPPGEFTARVAAYCRMMRETPPAKGYDEVLVAGDPEKRIEAERLVGGIPIPDGNWKDLVEAAARLGVAI